MGESTDKRYRLTRRQVVAGGAAAGSGLFGGCLGSMQQFLGLSSLNQVSLRVIAPPADWDRRANQIAGKLVERLKKVGIDARFPLVPPKQFRKQVLYDRDFDLYVGTMPIGHDPDYLRPLLTSTYTDALGWQNPFGFADISLDESLAEQHRQTGEERTNTIRRVIDTVAGEQPFVPIATDQAIAAISTDTFEGWERAPLRDPIWLLELEPASDSATDETLRLTAKDGSITQQLNPLVPWINEFDLVTSLLYDPLARYYDGAVRPWLVEEDWSIAPDADEVTVSLRPDLYWHDGEPITAEDIAFTYDFLDDTALGNADARYPAPRFQGQAQAVDTVTVVDDRTARFRVDASAATAPGLLTAPLLPKHVWRSRTGVSNARRGITQAIGHDNTGAVGSGPMTLESRSEGESVRFSRFEEHPLNRDDGSILADRFGQVAFSELVLSVSPSDLTMLASLQEGADVTVPFLDNKVVSGIANRDNLSLATSASRTLYHVGFNARRRPLRNPSFRRAVAHLVNKAGIVESIFDGYAEPRTTPVRSDSWIPQDLKWNNDDPEVPFVGVEDELFIENAREHFSNAGYHYTDEDILVY